MGRRNIVLSTLMTLGLILFAVLLYSFAYHTINNRFFEASVHHTVDTMSVIRDLGIEGMDARLHTLKREVEDTATQYAQQLMEGSPEDRAAILSHIELPEYGITYGVGTLQEGILYADGTMAALSSVPALQDVVSTGDTTIIDPYFTSDKEYLFVVAAPIYEEGQVSGVFLIQLDGYCLSEWMETIRFETGEGLSYMITGDGRNIAVSREINYDWIQTEYNSLELAEKDEETNTVAALERLPLEGKRGWGTYVWEGFTNYLVYAPMEEVDWGFFVGFYGQTLKDYIQNVTSESTASSEPLFLAFFCFMFFLIVYTNYNLRREKSYTAELLHQKEEIQKQAEELSVSEERFRIALGSTNSTIFEYNLQTGNMTNFRTTKEVMHCSTSCKALKDCLVLEGEIDAHSAQTLEHALEDIRDGLQKTECIIKTNLPDGEERWYRIAISAVAQEGQISVRIVGILEDITKEKMAERDPLTGLYHKNYVITRVSERLPQMKGSENCVFLMFDIDNFKTVNDTYGHPTGDQVIIQTANAIKDTFAENAVVGRIGGDEFCVFCYNTSSVNAIKDKLECLRKKMHTMVLPQHDDIFITYSCGVAFCSDKRKTFETLYQEADHALYQAKELGKNTYVIYQRRNIVQGTCEACPVPPTL